MLTVFVDESGADGKNRFLVHGALLVRHPALKPMRADIATRLSRYPYVDELKWSTTSKRRLRRDVGAVSTFFEIYETDGVQSSARYQCLVVDQHKVNARAFHNGDPDLCFYKLLYQLLLKRIGEMADMGEKVYVVLDERNTRRYDVNDLRSVLRNGLRKNLGWGAPDVQSVVYRKSHHEPMLQVADFLTGCVSFYRNGHHLKPERSHAKSYAGKWLSRKLKMQDLTIEQRFDPKFGIWTLRLKEAPPHRLAA